MATSSNVPGYSKAVTESGACEESMSGVIASSSGESVVSVDDSFQEVVENEEGEVEVILVPKEKVCLEHR